MVWLLMTSAPLWIALLICRVYSLSLSLAFYPLDRFSIFLFFFEMNTFPCDSHRWIDGYTESKFVVKAQAVVRMLLTD